MNALNAARAGAFTVAMLLGFTAQAATLDSIQGDVLVSREGSGYRVARAPTMLKAGDSVLANPGGAARVLYDNGCVVRIQPGMVLNIAEDPVCMTGSLKDDPVVVETNNDWMLPAALVAAVPAAGLAIVLTNDDDDERPRVPSSP